MVADYRKAKALLADQGPSPAQQAQQQGQQGAQQGAGMWSKLMDEVDKVRAVPAAGVKGRCRGGAGGCGGGWCTKREWPPPRTPHAPCLLSLPHSVAQVVGSVAHTLDTVVRSVQSGAGEAHDAIRHLLALQAVGVPAAQPMDPVGCVLLFLGRASGVRPV